MSWISKNKFIAGLVAATVVLCALSIYLGRSASARYDQALADYRAADASVQQFERLALYPSQDNLVGKTKSLADYETSIDNLAETFAKYQAPPPAPISPQEFGNRLVATNQQITARLNDASVAIPDGFYSGFEAYTTSLAQSAATPILDLQLNVVDAVMADLAAARPTALLNFRRTPQPEENGAQFQPNPGQIARPHNFELTFRATEPVVRTFLSTLASTQNRFIVIRIIRITNETTDPPKSSTAQFGTAAAPPPVAGPFGGAPFGNFDDLFGDADDTIPDSDPDAEPDDNEAEADGDGEAEAAPVAPPAPPAPAADGARILAQVAGSEMLNVFISFDAMQFLAPAKKANAEP